MRLKALVLLGFSLAGAFSVQAALTWRPGEGWTDESGSSEVSASSSRDQLQLAKKLEAANDLTNAFKAYSGLVRKWPLSFYAPEAQFKVGWLEEQRGDFWRAFKSYQKMVEKYPNSEYFDKALERQFALGNLFLAGEPQKLWKIPIGPSMDKTVEIYEQIIKNAPYGKYAPESQFKIGLAREKQKKYGDAVAAYNVIIDKYPGNDIVDDAQYQIGYAWFRASSEPDYDQSAAEKSIEAFEDFIVRYPNSEKLPQANENIVYLKNRQTQGAFNIAKFYEGQHNYKAAYIYYNEVVRQEPGSAQAQLAKKKVEELRPRVEKELNLPSVVANNPGSKPEKKLE
jgi:outer membrane protein assembly factor BamD